MVSIIVPVYNVAEYLSSCIRSILVQSCPDFELLLVDDGSTDASGEICDRFALQDSRIKVIHQRNAGVCAARNSALDQMKGEYCLLVDSDDFIHPDLLQHTLRVMEESQSDTVIYGYSRVEEAAAPCDVPEQVSEQYELLTGDAAYAEMLSGRRFRMLACNKLYKAELWEGVRFPEDRKYGDDSSVTYRLIGKCQRVALLEAKLYYYRNRQGSALNTRLSGENLQLFDAYSALLRFTAERKPYLLDRAFYAYVVRMFDFFLKLKTDALSGVERSELLSLLRKKSYLERAGLKHASGLTVKQRLLLEIFFMSPGLFWMLYSM